VAIYAQKGASFEATAQGFNTGLDGTLGVRIIDNVGGTTLARTTAGISELTPGSGLYGVTLVAPQIVGEYTVVWDDGTAGPEHTAAESLTVQSTTVVQVGTGTEGMTFGQILDDVLGNPDRFEAEMRGRAGRSVNIRYAHLWGLEDWTFRFAYTDLTASGNVLSPTALDFGTPLYLWDPEGNQLLYLDTEEFAVNYPPGSSPGSAAAWTVIAGEILLGPTPVSGGSYRCYYRRRLSQLVDEAEYPMIPPEYHLTLVHGGRAELLAVSDDPTYDHMERQFQQDIEAMKREYLIDAIGQPSMWPTDYAAVSS
jgi:hypothetical protein